MRTIAIMITTTLIIPTLSFGRDRASYPDPLRRNIVKVARSFEKNGGYCKAYLSVDSLNKDGTKSIINKWVRCSLENGRCPKNANNCWRNHKNTTTGSLRGSPLKNPKSCPKMRLK